jgi:hypothetical protein
MARSTTNLRFVIAFGVVWICFGIFGLFEAPERVLVTAAQFVAGIIHFIYAFLVWTKSK